MMRVETPEVKRILEDYDIVFSSGAMIPITIDSSKGDTISIDGPEIRVVLTSKPSQIKPNTFLPAEDIIIFKQHILTVQHRTREVIEPSLEEKEQWNKNWDKALVGGTIQ